MKLFYTVIFNAKRIYWFIARPQCNGVKCVITNKGRMLMLQRNFGTDKFVFPGGAIRNSESVEEAVKREIKEDLGITLNELIHLGSFTKEVHYRKETIFCFAARVNSRKCSIDRGKIINIAWFVPSDPPYLTPVSESVFEQFMQSAIK